MKTMRTVTSIAVLVLTTLPALAFAQVYYYAPGTTSGAYNYNSYIPASAMPYVNMGYQMQQQSQQQQQQSYSPYSYPSYNPYPMTQYYSYPTTQYQTQYQSQSQSQYQSSYPSYGYASTPSYGYMNTLGYSSSQPRSYSYPTGTVGLFGTQMCYWSDYPTYAPCGRDPQQWIQDPYTGMWY
jgi:hypothetical protein